MPGSDIELLILTAVPLTVAEGFQVIGLLPILGSL